MCRHIVDDMVSSGDVVTYLQGVKQETLSFFPGFVRVEADGTVMLMRGFRCTKEFDTYLYRIQHLPQERLQWNSETLKMSVDGKSHDIYVRL